MPPIAATGSQYDYWITVSYADGRDIGVELLLFSKTMIRDAQVLTKRGSLTTLYLFVAFYLEHFASVGLSIWENGSSIKS